MSSPEWTRQKKNKLIELYKQAPILWARKGQKIHPRQRTNALQKIADEIGVNVLEIEKKLHVLRSQFMRERKKILKSQLNGDEDAYQSHWQFYKRLEFLSGLLEPSNITYGVQTNANASEGESSNQSFSKGPGEPGDGSEDFENQPTQLYLPVQREASTVQPSNNNISPNSFLREEDSFQNVDDSDCVFQLDESEVSQDETSNIVDSPVGGIDDSLVIFGKYLISYLRRLPRDKSIKLQHKFLTETFRETIQFDKECSLLQKRRKTLAHNQTYPTVPIGSRQDQSRADGPSDKGTPHRTHASGSQDINSEKTGQVVRSNKTYETGTYHALNGMSGVTPEISIEEGPQINLIKKELETNFETVYCSGFTPISSIGRESALEGLLVPPEDSSHWNRCTTEEALCSQTSRCKK